MTFNSFVANNRKTFAVNVVKIETSLPLYSYFFPHFSYIVLFLEKYLNHDWIQMVLLRKNIKGVNVLMAQYPLYLSDFGKLITPIAYFLYY